MSSVQRPPCLCVPLPFKASSVDPFFYWLLSDKLHYWLLVSVSGLQGRSITGKVNLEKSWNFKMVISRPGKVMEKT